MIIMEATWFHDESLEVHPVAPLAVGSLKRAGIRLRLASADRPQAKGDHWYFPTQAPVIDGFFGRKARWYKPLSVRFGYARSPVLAFMYLDKSICRFLAAHRPSRLCAAIKLARKSPQCIIVSRGRLLLFVMPWYISRRLFNKSTRVVYYPFELFGQQGHAEPLIERKFERWFIRRITDVVITQNIYRCDYYQSMGCTRPVLVVRNFGSRYSQKSSVQPDSTRQSLTHKIIYAGLLHKKRSIGDLIAAVADLSDTYQLTLIGQTNSDFHIREIAKAEELMLTSRLIVRDEVSKTQLFSLLSSYEIGVLNYDASCLNNVYCAPAKLTDYLHAGLSVVAPNYPALREVVSGLPWIHWFQPGDAHSMTKALVEAVDYRYRNFGSHFATLSRELCWENEEAQLVSAVTG